ncbi:MAG: Endolytic murein transglycosylase [Paracidovorax wautersii]|uniref:Endolytic murein transglycosylase n=1 Tax=Paracidovorax wautersii TaxID=1177982 RepID=A0A7V8FN84_9BURK|nr:MAG: Endolytic murein transglycosylase [Paracidovorax wautersii]
MPWGFDLRFFRKLIRLLLSLVLVALVLGGAAAWWVQRPLPQQADVVDLAIERGESARDVAQGVAAAGVQVPPPLLYVWFRLSGHARDIKAGSYEIKKGTSPAELLDMLANGRQALRQVTLVEGWTFRQFREALARADHLKPDTAGLSGAEIMARLGRDSVAPEGRFFPDTYIYPKNTSDLLVLRQALQAMDRRLEAAWSVRAPNLPLKTPDDALILASIVEKETGLAADRGQIAGVFANRLRIGMPLQTDPTVIYGASEANGVAFEGRLRRAHLDTDTPWNTYTRTGLPPTPIAMPGNAALMAAVQPEATTALYFVSRGDGSSQFSPSLNDHNRAVDQFIRKK